MEFPFPYEHPYKVQKDFMKDLYRVIDSGKIGFFESPTGTGKSLSLICGAMKWIKDDQTKDVEQIVQDRMKEYLKEEKVNSKDPKWLIEQQRKRVSSKIRQEILLKREDEKEKKDRLEKLRAATSESIAKRRKSGSLDAGGAGIRVSNSDIIHYDEQDQLLADYKSDDEAGNKENHQDSTLLPADPPPKIVYSSRTHSQISQFVSEIKKTVYCDARVVTLGSRNSLCLNENVRNLSSLAQVNDACLDMQGGKKEACCSFRRPDSNRDRQALSTFSLHIQAVIRDIEEIGLLGKQLHTCPYYATRNAVPDCDIICLPYNLLLQKSARESCGISLKNAIVIIDESHNIIDAINAIHTIIINERQLERCREQLSRYYDRYKSKLAPKNSLYIKQLLLLILRLKALKSTEDSKLFNQMHTVPKVVSALQIEHINLFKILRFIEVSKLANKLQGFSEKDGSVGTLKHESPLRQTEALLKTLAYPNEDGRILLSYCDEGGFQIKFLLLNPSNVFTDIVQTSKSLILAGGTMSPVDDLLSQLFPAVSRDQIHHFKCGHVINPQNLLPLIVATGPNSIPFNFSFKNRNNTSMILETGRALLKICQSVPKGVIIFFPSYSYLEQVSGLWKSNGILHQIAKIKSIFAESRESDKQQQQQLAYLEKVEDVLGSYTRAVSDKEKNGAILLSVVGGKMSEGINFSDDLGRAVVMVGLPYANLHSIELQEKMKYLDSQQQPNVSGLKTAGREYYENLCMKAVNQSIGRAIRHEKDFAAIILLDERFSSPKIQQKLPDWILRSAVGSSLEGFAEANDFLKGFFDTHFSK